MTQSNLNVLRMGKLIPPSRMEASRISRVLISDVLVAVVFRAVPECDDAVPGVAVGSRPAAAAGVRAAGDAAVLRQTPGRGWRHLQAHQVRRGAVGHGLRPQPHRRFA